MRRLGTDYIDVLSLHTPDPFTPVDETMRALQHLVDRGYVRYVGYSNYPAWLAATMVERQRARGYATMAAAQLYYSLVGRDIEHDHVPFARAAGIGIVVWSPLAGGFLTGRYTRETPTGDGGRLAAFDFIPLDKERAYDVVARLAEMAGGRDVTVPQLALAWLLAKPHVSSVLLGASRRSQLEDNLGAADLALTAEELDELDHLAAPTRPYPNWYLEQIGGDPAVTAALDGRAPTPAAT